MIIYCYDNNGIYLRPISPALSPAAPFNAVGNPNYLIPPLSTEIEPPMCKDSEVPVFKDGGWSCVTNKIGEVVYSKNDQSTFTIDSLGAIPEGFTEVAPPSKQHIWDTTSNGWSLNLVAVRIVGQEIVDSQAEDIRNSIITPGSGQMGAYLRKEQEARALIIDTAPTPDKYPFINAEIGITGPDLLSVAKVIVASADAWWGLGAEIEKCRLQGKKDISNAISQDDINSIIKNIPWPKVG